MDVPCVREPTKGFIFCCREDCKHPASRSCEVKDTDKQTVEGSDSDHEDSDGGGDGHSDEDLDFHIHYHGSSGGPNAYEASGSGAVLDRMPMMLQVVAQRMQMWVQPCLQLPMCR